jgi:hypothetical protein
VDLRDPHEQTTDDLGLVSHWRCHGL